MALINRCDLTRSPVLVEEPLRGVVLLVDVALRQRHRSDRQALTSCADRLLQLVEQDLEAPESLIEEVFGLVTESAGVGFSDKRRIGRTRAGVCGGCGVGDFATVAACLIGPPASGAYTGWRCC